MPTAPTGPATRAHRRTSLAVRLLQDADPIPQGQRFLSRSKAMVLGRRLLTFPQLAVLRLLPTRENARAATRALAPSDISSRRCTTRSRLCGNRGPTYVRANSAASSSVHTVTSRARRRGGLNTKSIMPRKLARHSRSSSGAVDAADNARNGGRITKRLWATGDIVDVLEAWEAARQRKSAATAAMPRCLVLRIVPCCLPQPKMHSVIAPAEGRKCANF